MIAYCKQNHKQISGMIFVSNWLTKGKLYPVEITIKQEVRGFADYVIEEEIIEYHLIGDDGYSKSYTQQEFDIYFEDLEIVRQRKIDSLL